MATRKNPSVAATNKLASNTKAAKPVKKANNSGAKKTPDPGKPKQKLVRDSFTIPKSEYAVLAELKQRAAQLVRPIKKSELLRAGIMALSTMTDRSFLSALDAVPSLKAGRPLKIEAAPLAKSLSKKR